MSDIETKLREQGDIEERLRLPVSESMFVRRSDMLRALFAERAEAADTIAALRKQVSDAVGALELTAGALQAAPQAPAVRWPEPKVISPDIANPTGNPYLDCLIHRLLDAQQDINLSANTHMDQALCDASSLIDEVERCIRTFARSALEAETDGGESGCAFNNDHLAWACERWQREVAHRPLRNVHRRTLDDTWRQVIRRLGGDPNILLPMSDHDSLVANNPEQAVQPATTTDERAVEALIEKYAPAVWTHDMAAFPREVIRQHFREFANEVAALAQGESRNG